MMVLRASSALAFLSTSSRVRMTALAVEQLPEDHSSDSEDAKIGDLLPTGPTEHSTDAHMLEEAKKLAVEKPQANYAVSEMGVEMLLKLMLGGSNGDTEDQLSKALGGLSATNALESYQNESDILAKKGILSSSLAVNKWLSKEYLEKAEKYDILAKKQKPEADTLEVFVKAEAKKKGLEHMAEKLDLTFNPLPLHLLANVLVYDNTFVKTFEEDMVVKPYEEDENRPWQIEHDQVEERTKQLPRRDVDMEEGSDAEEESNQESDGILKSFTMDDLRFRTLDNKQDNAKFEDVEMMTDKREVSYAELTAGDKTLGQLVQLELKKDPEEVEETYQQTRGEGDTRLSYVVPSDDVETEKQMSEVLQLALEKIKDPNSPDWYIIEAYLALPKFKLESEADLTDCVENFTNGAHKGPYDGLGLSQKVIDENNLTFEYKQKIAMEVDCKGARAIAVTTQECLESFSWAPVVVANKPFYAIVSTKVGDAEKIVLVAHVRNPSARAA